MIFIKIIFAVGKTALFLYVELRYHNQGYHFPHTLMSLLRYGDLRKVYRNLRFIAQTQKSIK